MARKKSNKFTGIFKIFFSSLYSYFLYLDQTLKQLAFPVFGQILSISLIFTLTYLFNTNFDKIQSSNGLFNEEKTLITVFFIILAPLFLILIKAFYDYIINFASLNLLFYTHSNKKTAKQIDFSANNDVIQRRLFKYILLMIISVPMLIIAPFLCLTFQVFALEADASAIKCIKRSIEMIKSNFIPSIILLLLCFGFTYVFLPALFIWACEKTPVYYFLLNNCEKFCNLFGSNDYLSTVDMARLLLDGAISTIVIGFTLPFRCCCFTELYRLLDSEKIKEFSKQTDEIITRATGKKRKN